MYTACIPTHHEFFSLEVLEVQVKFQHKVKELYFQNEVHVFEKNKTKQKKTRSIFFAYEFHQSERVKPLVNSHIHAVIFYITDYHTYNINII